MKSNWLDFLRASGARIDQQLVADFGDPAGELVAAQEQTIFSPLSHLGLIAVSGPEAADFLHNQLTSDVRHLPGEMAQHSAWCSAKGRMLASLLVFRIGPDYFLQLSADLVEPTLRRLQMFVLRSRLTLGDASDEDARVGVSGPGAETALRAAGLPVPELPLAVAAFPAGVVIRLDRTRWEVVVDCDAAPMVWQQLTTRARPAGSRAWQWLDICLGVPLITAATSEEFVPQMAGFDRLGALSFRKGCYPGQEVVARTQYLGKVKRHLYRAHSAAPLLPGQLVYSPANPQQHCGVVANAAPSPAGGHDALVVAQDNFVPAGDAQLELASPGGAAIRVGPMVDVASAP
ncbi:folate-binding protein YgfZ [Accumulibacter sp.]|uniref:CAF17-like 4Fe-4S cluster assembly/insertion protein YgfZ n=1 Tax=Accumulibacter sp. TaxID=2053492 RepID=UPI0025DF6A08|nr:folate-binding protein [Accumulibacter sp.]MCM8594572.1 folate-binding protein [Accumulibacter sp.]MCM8627420.1 folate-binding protein [Accumulibacter sp.]MDS4048718.1 folate-binding protein [Accumulibacter sp.]